MSNNKLQVQLLDIFEKLLGHFGPRHWWPADTKFEVVIGCILTQNVSWKNVEQAVKNLKERQLINIDGLLETPDNELAGLIRTTRYYNQKASCLKNFCSFIKTGYNSSFEMLFQKELWELRSTLLSLKGIGRETADSIILYAANKPIFVVDLYTKRIFSRLGLIDYNAEYDDIQKFFMSNLPNQLYLFNEYHALIDALGHNYCKACNPDCVSCPLKTVCNKNGIK